MNTERFTLVNWFVYSIYIWINFFIMTFTLSLFELWVFIEIITFTFLVIALLDSNRYTKITEGLVSYFLIQSALSMLLLLLIVLLSTYLLKSPLPILLVVFAKVGVLPFGFWVFPVLSCLDEIALFNAIVYQKIPPLMIAYPFLTMGWLTVVLIILNLLIASSVAFARSQVVSLLIFRSIANNSWFVLSLIIDLYYPFIFLFAFYSIGVALALSSTRLISRLGLLNLSGLPPFPLFFAKLGVLIILVNTLNHSLTLLIGFFFLLSRILLRASYIRFLSTYWVLSFAYSI